MGFHFNSCFQKKLSYHLYLMKVIISKFNHIKHLKTQLFEN